MSTVSTHEESIREASRDKSNGRFGERHHGDPGISLAGTENPIAGLEDFIAAQADTIEGRDRANRARMSIAARALQESVPEAATILLEGEPGDWKVGKVWDKRGWPLKSADNETVAAELRSAGVTFTSSAVSLAAARDWTPDAITPTSPKVTSKGRTVYVTLPDGAVVDRTSKSREYTHAVVATPEDPERVKIESKRLIEESQLVINDIDEALAAEKLTIRRSQRFRDGRDPDVDYKGNPVYNGFEYKVYSADGKRVLADVWGNSKQEVQGNFDEDGNYDSKKIVKVFPAAASRLAEKRRLHQSSVDKHLATVESVEDGTYNVGGWAVYSFSGSAANAEKAARSSQGYTPSRRFTVMPIDQ